MAITRVGSSFTRDFHIVKDLKRYRVDHREGSEGGTLLSMAPYS